MAIPLIGPDGREYEIADPAKLQDAIALGYRPVTADAPPTLLEQAKGFGSQAVEGLEAAVEGGVQGLSAGLYGAALGRERDAAESDADFARREFRADEYLARKEENPVPAMGGELAGMVFSPVNKVGAVVRGGIGATTAIGRIGAGIAGGATEGALFGAGNTLSDAALGDQDLTAQKMIAGAGLGALLGGAGGGIGTGLAEGFKAVAPKLGSIVGLADDVANESTIAATRAQQGVVNRMSEEQLGAAAKALRDRGHLSLTGTPDDMLKAVEADVAKVGGTKGAFLDAAEASGAQPSLAAFGKRLDDFEAGLNSIERDAVAADLKAARNALDDLGAKAPGLPGKSGSGFRALDDLKQTIQAKAKFSRGPTPLDDVTMGLKRQLSGVFREELDSQLLPALGADAAKFLETKAIYGALKDAARLAESGSKRAGGVGMKDLLVGNMGSALHPVGLAAAIGSKYMRERGPAVIAVLADKIAKSPQLGIAAQGLAAKIETLAPQMGKYALPISQAFARSPAEGLATHMAMAQTDPGYAESARMAGLLPETPEEHQAAMGKANGLAAMAHQMDAQNTQIQKSLKAVFHGEKPAKPSKVMGSQDFGAKRMRRDESASHNKRVEEIRELAANPDALLERFTANIGSASEMAPGVAAAMARTAHRAVAFLAQEAAEPPRAGPLAPKWVATEAEMHNFASVLGAVQEPLSVLRDAAAGTLTPDQWRAVEAVYPLLARQIQDQALEMLAAPPKEVPYSARLMISMITGVDVDGTMSPAAILANQDAIGAAPSKPSNTGQKDSSLSLGSRMATPGQKREAEESANA